MDSNNTKQKLGLVFIPLPGIGHLISMVEFIKNLLLYHQFTAIVLPISTVDPSPQVSSYISSVEADPDLDITFHRLPKMGNHHLSPMDLLKPNVKTAIPPSTHIAAMIADMFCTDMVDVAHELGVPFYIFFSSTASFLGFLLYLPTLDAKLPDGKNIDELGEEEEDSLLPIPLPGFTSALPEIAIPQCCFRRNNHIYSSMLHSGYRYREAQGIVINTSMELEPNIIKALEEGKYLTDHPTPPVYPVGPFLSINLDPSPSPSDKQQHECIQWLNLQSPRSVVFLCFGSKGTFSTDQVREIAIGLERTGHRFLWVLRSPPPPRTSPVAEDAVLDEVLPEGFMERIKKRGMVWPKFAPQTEILRHEAIGGFVTHCGWNSIIESLWFGVPMLAWPLSAEQHLNAFEIVTEMETAIGLKVDRKGENCVDAKEVEKGVRCLMEEECCDQSKKVRSTTAEMSKKMKKALEEGGSSLVYMEKLTLALTSNVKSWIK